MNPPVTAELGDEDQKTVSSKQPGIYKETLSPNKNGTNNKNRTRVFARMTYKTRNKAQVSMNVLPGRNTPINFSRASIKTIGILYINMLKCPQIYSNRLVIS